MNLAFWPGIHFVKKMTERAIMEVTYHNIFYRLAIKFLSRPNIRFPAPATCNVEIVKPLYGNFNDWYVNYMYVTWLRYKHIIQIIFQYVHKNGPRLLHL